jgi:hypothetical protein
MGIKKMGPKKIFRFFAVRPCVPLDCHALQGFPANGVPCTGERFGTAESPLQRASCI